jgi:hypothetical protein
MQTIKWKELKGRSGSEAGTQHLVTDLKKKSHIA